MEPRVTVDGKPRAEKPSALRRNPVLFEGVVVLLLAAVAVGDWHIYTHRPSVEPASVENMVYPLPDKPAFFPQGVCKKC
jgi:hypothetical protein